jgi:hypothetical protein
MRPVRVVLEPIELHDQNALDEQVDPADAIEVDLTGPS